MRKLPQIKYFSPLGLLALTACGGENSTISTLLSGKVIKGPLNNALVGLDYDGDGVVDSATVRTDANGGYSISTTQTTYTVIAVTDASTIDTSSGAVLSGVTLKAPESATVVTPTTTLMKEGNLTVEQVASVLGLPDGVDPLTFNPYADGVSATDALAVEKASQQVMSVVNAFASAAEGSGATEAAAYTAAMNSIVEVVKTKAAASDTLDLSNTADLALIKAQVITEVASIEGVTSETTTAFDALADDTATAVENVNTEIAKASDLTSGETKSIFSTTQVLADQVKAAAVAEVASSGTGSIDFIDSASVVTSAANAMPSSVDLSLSSISEGAESLVVGVLSTVDSDQPDGVAFKYEIAEITGTDYASFSINQSTGELSLKTQPDYETKSTYSVTILSTDSGGKTLSETFTVVITDANDAPTLTVPTTASVTEDASVSTITGNLVGSDPESDSLTYSIVDVTASSGSYSLAGTYGTLVLNATTGAYTYTLDNSATATNALAAGGSETETFSVKVSDGTNITAAQNLSFTINGANDAPSSIALDSTSVVENSAGAIVGALSGSDAEGTSVIYSVVDSGDGSLFEIDGSNNLKLKTASADYETKPSYNLTVNASDGDLQTSTVFNVSVSDVNEAPTWDDNVATIVVEEDADLSFDLSTISSDDDGDGLIYELIETPDWVTLSEGVLTGTPINADVGVNDIRVKVSDGTLDATKALRVDVTNTSDDSVVTGDAVGSLTEQGEDSVVTATGSLSINDVDAGDSPSFADVTDAATVSGYGTVSLADGEWVYTLDNSAVNDLLSEGDTVTDSYTFVATDGSTHEIVITITGINTDAVAPTISKFDVVPESSGTLGIGNTVIYTATASEVMGANTSMSITLSNSATVTLTVVADAPTTLKGTYTISASDNDASDLTITAYSALTAADLSGNSLSTTAAIGDISGSETQSIVIDATAPTAKIAINTPHTYDASTGVLTLAASELSTMGAEDGDDVKAQVDMTKLSWDINQSGSSLETFTNDDVTSIIQTSTDILTITFTADKTAELAGTTDLGGQSSNLDGLDIAEGFLNDDTGNASEQTAVNNADVAMTDTAAPTISKFDVVPESSDILGAGNTVVYTATANEAMRSDTTMSITLSNDATVTLTVVAAAPTTLKGTYTISASDNDASDLTIAQYTALTAVDISGNALDDTTTAIGDIAGSKTVGDGIVVDTQAPTAKIAINTPHTYDASTGVLTLAASELSTMGAEDGDDVKAQVDMTKLSWDINQSGSSLETFTNDDVTSIIQTSTDILTITFTADKTAELAGTTDLGGQSSNLDGLDIAEGFLNDNAGNASEQTAVNNADVAMSDTAAPTLSGFSVAPEIDGTLGIGNTVVYTATANEAMRSDTTMSITLSNDATVTLTVDAAAPTTLKGTYTISASDNDASDLTIAQYTALTAVDISGNALDDTTTAIGDIAGSGTIGAGIVVDAQAPTAAISATGHIYNASTGVLTLAASELSTMGAEDGANVKAQVDMTKLSWDINKLGSSLETFTNDDVTSIIQTSSDVLTITFTTAKTAELAGTTDLGGQSSNLDGLDIAEGFLNDNAGNASEQADVNNADVAMTDTTAPTISSFSVVPETSDTLGIGKTVVYTATANEAMRSDTTMSITLSNDATVTLTVDAAAPTTLKGTYTISASDNDASDLTIAQYTALTAVDISGNALDDTTTAIGDIAGSGTQSIVVDTVAPSLSAGIDAENQSLVFLFTEEISNQDEISAVLRSLDITADAPTITWAESGQNVNVETLNVLSEGDLSIDLTIKDLAGNERTFDEIPLNIL